MSDEPYSGWTVLELMGHRRLAGMVRETTIAGAGFFEIRMPSACSGIGATYCDVHGDCRCRTEAPEVGDPAGEREPSDDPGCALHAPGSDHGEEWYAVQFYPPSAVYCITPCTETAARRVAGQHQPRPVPAARLSLPPARTCRECGDDLDGPDDLCSPCLNEPPPGPDGLDEPDLDDSDWAT